MNKIEELRLYSIFQLIFDYCTRVPVSVENAKKNFEELLGPLAHILEHESPETELAKMKILESVESSFLEDQSTWPSVQFWDVSMEC